MNKKQMYLNSLDKFTEIKNNIYNDIQRRDKFDYNNYGIYKLCSFCINYDGCNDCLINKEICGNESNAGLINNYRNTKTFYDALLLTDKIIELIEFEIAKFE